MMDARKVASKIILEILQDKGSLATALPKYFQNDSDTSQNALTQEICYGLLRWFDRLNFIAKQLLEKPLKQKDQDIYVLILIGLYQIIFMRIPDYASVSEIVSAIPSAKKQWAKGLVNAILRSFIREEEKIMQLVDQNEIAKYSHPKWLIQEIKKAWPNDYETIFKLNNAHPPMNLRVNRRAINREKYLILLNEKNISAKANPVACDCITLSQPKSVDQLPGFQEGKISVQDCGAQLVGELLDLQRDQRVLDACAAPGGKTTHILEIQPNIKELVSIDNEAKRLKLVDENLQRLKFKANVVCADVSDLKQWWNGELFDRILLDAPCSATGVIRRHPDIKLLRKETDIKKLAEQQYALLRALWQVLKPHGKLIYVTCSVLPEENQKVIERFLQQNFDAREEKIDARWGIELTYGRQLLPRRTMDGFYFAKLIKGNHFSVDPIHQQ